MKKKILCFDVDNTICVTNNQDYLQSKPIKPVIKLINKLYKNGYYIKIYTARYMGRNNDNVKKAYKQGYKDTLKQLKSWKLEFHRLYFGKPSFDILIDDRSYGHKKKWYNNFIKNFKKFK